MVKPIGHPGSINVFKNNTSISTLQCSNEDFFFYSYGDDKDETVIPGTQLDNSHPAKNQTTCEEGCKICKCDDNHNNLLLCEGCNGEFHTNCLIPPLNFVLEDDFFSQKCKAAGKDDGMLELIKNLPNTYSDRFGKIVWVKKGPGYGFWPVVVYYPMEISGDMYNQYRKELRGKVFFDASNVHLANHSCSFKHLNW
jgi:hypothetical protein